MTFTRRGFRWHSTDALGSSATPSLVSGRTGPPSASPNRVTGMPATCTRRTTPIIGTSNDYYGHPSPLGFKDMDHLWHTEHRDPEPLVKLSQ